MDHHDMQRAEQRDYIRPVHPVIKSRRKAIDSIIRHTELYCTSVLGGLSDARLIELYDTHVKPSRSGAK